MKKSFKDELVVDTCFFNLEKDEFDLTNFNAISNFHVFDNRLNTQIDAHPYKLILAQQAECNRNSIKSE